MITNSGVHLSGLRRVGGAALRILVPVFAAAALIQVAAAGGAVFGAMSWGMHASFGGIVEVIALLTFVSVVLARPSRDLVAAIAVAFAATLLQPISYLLSQQLTGFGVLHALDALVIFGAIVWALRTLFVSPQLVSPAR
ncbi:MAG: DUF6220 domain-containing protein [Candidatus Dormibacteraceae bacterium]